VVIGSPCSPNVRSEGVGGSRALHFATAVTTSKTTCCRPSDRAPRP